MLCLVFKISLILSRLDLLFLFRLKFSWSSTAYLILLFTKGFFVSSSKSQGKDREFRGDLLVETLMKDEVDFLPADKHQRLFELMLSFQVYVARHTQIDENNTFSISLQYFKQEVSDEVDFFKADEMKVSYSFLGSMIFDGDDKAFPKFRIWQACKVFSKKVRDKVGFINCMHINIKFSCKLISTFWSSKFPIR